MQGAVYLSAQDRAWLQALVTTEFQKVERFMTQVSDEITALGNQVQSLTVQVANMRATLVAAASAAALVASLQQQLAAAHAQIDANTVTSDDLTNLASLTSQIGQATADLQSAVAQPPADAESTTDSTATVDTVTGGAGNDVLVSPEDAGAQTIDGSAPLSPDVPATAQ